MGRLGACVRISMRGAVSFFDVGETRRKRARRRAGKSSVAVEQGKPLIDRAAENLAKRACQSRSGHPDGL